MQPPHFAGRSLTAASIDIYIHPTFYLYAAFMILILPRPWVFAIVTAAAVHECGHLLALRLMGISVTSLRLELFGALIQTPPLQPWQEVIAAVSGPMSGFVLFAFYAIFPKVGLCAFVQTMFNLLPILPFDGGRILRSCMQMIFGPRVVLWVCRIVAVIVITAMFVLGIWAAKFSS